VPSTNVAKSPADRTRDNLRTVQWQTVQALSARCLRPAGTIATSLVAFALAEECRLGSGCAKSQCQQLPLASSCARRPSGQLWPLARCRKCACFIELSPTISIRHPGATLERHFPKRPTHNGPSGGRWLGAGLCVESGELCNFAALGSWSSERPARRGRLKTWPRSVCCGLWAVVSVANWTSSDKKAPKLPAATVAADCLHRAGLQKSRRFCRAASVRRQCGFSAAAALPQTVCGAICVRRRQFVRRGCTAAMGTVSPCYQHNNNNNNRWRTPSSLSESVGD